MGAFSCLLVLYRAEWALVAEPELEAGGPVRVNVKVRSVNGRWAEGG